MKTWREEKGKKPLNEKHIINVGEFELTVHRHLDRPADAWCVSMRPAILPMRDLQSKDTEKAKAEALRLTYKFFQKGVREFEKLFEKNPFLRP